MTSWRATTFFLPMLLVACATGGDTHADEGSVGRGLGVRLRTGAVVYCGSGAFCSRPATVDAAVVTAATPEWSEIQRDGVREGSARHSLLKAAMHDRIVAACKKAAMAEGQDLVVRSGDVDDARGMTVVDLTAAVVRSL